MSLYRAGVDPIPMYETGILYFDRAFDTAFLRAMATEADKVLARVEGECLRQAHRAAAEQSLTVLTESSKWIQTDMGKLFTVHLTVRHEPQADDQLVYAVAARLYKNMDLWTAASPVQIALAAVQAVRDLGRLAPIVPRPEGIPE